MIKLLKKNLSNYISSEKGTFIITILCIISSAIVMFLAYGLYQNYHVIIETKGWNSKETNMYIDFQRGQDGTYITKKQLTTFIESLKETTLMDVNGIDSYFVVEDELFDVNFVYKDGDYYPNKEYQDYNILYEYIDSGRQFTKEEYSEGALVAMVPNATFEKQYPTDTISLFGKEFEVIGVEGFCDTPIIPITTYPDDIEVDDLVLGYDFPVTKNKYYDIKNCAEAVFGDLAIVPEMRFEEESVAYFYKTIMLISVIIALVAASNFAVTYRYILGKRVRKLAIFRLCGMKKRTAFVLFLSECYLLMLPLFAVGVAVFKYLILPAIKSFYPYLEEAYNKTVYLAIGGIYLGVSTLVLSILIGLYVNKNVMTMLGGEKG